MKSIWTASEENQLRAMVNTHTNKEIGKLLGKDRKDVAGKLYRMGLKRATERVGGATTTIRLSDTMRAALERDATEKQITIGSIVRAIIAEHYGLEGERIVAVRGGKRMRAGRPRLSPVTFSKPSMPFVNIGRD